MSDKSDKKTEIPVFHSADTNISAEITEHLAKAFNYFNAKLAGGTLKKPIFTLVPNKGKKKFVTLGWYCESIWKSGDKQFSELNITSDTLSRPFPDILQTLIHEMAHLANSQLGIKDCVNAIHNKRFKKKAEEFGLKVEKMQSRGYAHTSLDLKAQGHVENYINTLTDKNPLQHFRVDANASKPKYESKKVPIGVCRILVEDYDKQDVDKKTIGRIVDKHLRIFLEDLKAGKVNIEDYDALEEGED